MVLDYYNLKEQPFGVTPDPRYLYPSPTHREALASLRYGIQSGLGFMSIIATPGMGKTTILFQLLQQLESSARTVFLFQTLCNGEALMSNLLRDLDVNYDGADMGRMQAQLNDVLLAEARQDRKIVVVIDEAQNLEDSALEMVRLLSNFETTTKKVMQIILCGQPQLREKLASPHLLQLRQRISIFARLQPFTVAETGIYVNHRLQVAGYDFKTPLFSPAAEALIGKYSQGIPRNINNICFNALSLGSVSKQKTIQADVIREVLDDLYLDAPSRDTTAPEVDSTGLALVPLESYAKCEEPSSGARFVWQKRLAVCLLLLGILVALTGGWQRVKAFGSHPTNPAAVGSRVEQEHKSPPAPTSSQPAVDRPSAPGDVDEDFVGALDVIVVPRQRPPAKLAEASFKQTNDPAKLWAEVRNNSTDAEVELAQIYLEGKDIPQNCAQARILLLAASRKGNARADDLLTDYTSHCR
jgi:general secretion pathway protein A